MIAEGTKRAGGLSLLTICFAALVGRSAQAQHVDVEVIRKSEWLQVWVHNTETRSIRITGSFATECTHVAPCGSGSAGQILRPGERIMADNYAINCGMGEGNYGTNCPASVKYQVQAQYYGK